VTRSDLSGTPAWRRPALIAAAIVIIAAIGWLFLRPAPGGDTRPVLRVGDQRGGIETLLAASDFGDSSKYRIEWSSFPSGTPLIEAINAGAIDIGLVGDGSLIVARSAHVPVKAVTTIRDVVTGSRLFVAPNSPLHAIADLKGHSIAVQRGTALHLMVLNILASAGLGEKDIDFKFLAPEESRAAFVNGDVDAWATTDPFVAMEELSPKPARVLVNGDSFMLNAVYLVASEDAIANKHAELADFIARTRSAYAWSNSNPDAYAALLAKQTGLPMPIAKRMIERRKPRFADVDPALMTNIGKAVSVYRSTGLIDRPVPAEDLFDTSFPVAQLPTVGDAAPQAAKP
jgi:sulfonate transport system substrate-binding protein